MIINSGKVELFGIVLELDFSPQSFSAMNKVNDENFYAHDTMKFMANFVLLK